MKRILTGVKPTGYAHIGNYFGAIKPAIDLSNNSEFECYYFIADYHALTTVKSSDEFKEFYKNIACTWLACGLNPDKVVFYRQSDIKEDFELNWILCNLTPKGLMNRAHAYKAKVEENEQNGVDRDLSVNMGLYNYPILMASDILIFDTNLVPVGLDQKQHIEIARDIASSFNSKYGNTFVLPEDYIQESSSVILGLDGRKMSKSYGNQIQLFTDEKTLEKTIKRIVTDSKLPGEPKETDCTINQLYKLFVSKEKAKEFEQKLIDGLGWGDAKKELFAVMNEFLSPMREKYFYYYNHFDEVEKILKDGAVKARKIANDVLQRVRKQIGVED